MRPALETEKRALVLLPGLVILEECGHLPTLERPLEVNAALRAWLGE